MRYFVLALMIFLLPLRGWAGDVMAIQMAGSAGAIEKSATRTHKAGVKASFDDQKQVANILPAVPDCHDLLASHSGTTDTPINDHCSTCAACQSCHTVALSPTSPGPVTSFSQPQVRQANAARFTSADAALDQKPPIA